MNIFTKTHAYITQEQELYTDIRKTVIIVGICVLALLIMFQPWGLDTIPNSTKYSILLGYALISSAICLVNIIVTDKTIQRFHIKWTIWKHFLFLLWMIVSIAVVNILYTKIIFDDRVINALVIFRFVWYTLVVAIVPIALLLLLSRNFALRRNLAEAIAFSAMVQNSKTTLNNEYTPISIFNKSKTECLETMVEELLYIESQENYVQLYYIAQGKTNKKTLRCTMQYIEEQLCTKHTFRRCHRAYIVNTIHIKSAYGNAQGYKLCISHCENEIPVSRTYIEHLKDFIV